MGYKIERTTWNNKTRYFRLWNKHSNADYLDRLKNLILHKHYVSEGFYELDPAIGVPTRANDVIKNFKPLFQFNEEQYKVWIEFNQFIIPLDSDDTCYVLDSKVMDVTRIAPYEFMESLSQESIGGLGVRYDYPSLIAINRDKIKNYTRRHGKEVHDWLEVLSICTLLFYEASEVVIMHDDDGVITMHWEEEEMHSFFVHHIMAVFVANIIDHTHHSIFNDYLSLPDLDVIGATVKQLQFNRQSLFIYHYCQYIDKHGHTYQEALNYGLSKVVINKFNL